jgi:hypothetical protein
MKERERKEKIETMKKRDIVREQRDERKDEDSKKEKHTERTEREKLM